MPSEKRWTLYVCPNCRRVDLNRTLCTACEEPERLEDGCTTPRWHRCDRVEVVRADAPNVLSVEDAREIVAAMRPSSQSGGYDIRHLLSTWVDEQEEKQPCKTCGGTGRATLDAPGLPGEIRKVTEVCPDCCGPDTGGQGR